jgi:hypothetical protein
VRSFGKKKKKVKISEIPLILVSKNLYYMWYMLVIPATQETDWEDQGSRPARA